MKVYPCGCSASGGLLVLPDDCPIHGKPVTPKELAALRAVAEAAKDALVSIDECDRLRGHEHSTWETLRTALGSFARAEGAARSTGATSNEANDPAVPPKERA